MRSESPGPWVRVACRPATESPASVVLPDRRETRDFSDPGDGLEPVDLRGQPGTRDPPDLVDRTDLQVPLASLETPDSQDSQVSFFVNFCISFSCYYHYY